MKSYMKQCHSNYGLDSVTLTLVNKNSVKEEVGFIPIDCNFCLKINRIKACPNVKNI